MSAMSWYPSISFPQLARKVDPRALRVGTLLAAVCVLNIIDLSCTLFAQRMGMGFFNEMNPFAEVFIRMGLIPSLICFKILMVFCGVGLLWKARHNRLVIPACWVLLIAYICLSITWCQWISNVNSDMEIHIANALPMSPNP